MEQREFEFPLNFRGKDYKATLQLIPDQKFLVGLPEDGSLSFLGLKYQNGKWKNRPLVHPSQIYLPTKTEVNAIGNKILSLHVEHGISL